MVRKRLPRMQKRLGRKQLAKALLKAPVYNVHFSKGRVSLQFFGYKVSYRVVVKRNPYVGFWSRKRPNIFIDKHFSQKESRDSFQALCVHEAIEKFISQKLHFYEHWEPHEIALQKEREFLESIGGSWKRHQSLVYWDWKKHGKR